MTKDLIKVVGAGLLLFGGYKYFQHLHQSRSAEKDNSNFDAYKSLIPHMTTPLNDVPPQHSAFIQGHDALNYRGFRPAYDALNYQG